MAPVQRWFQPSQPANADWHAYSDDSPVSYCHAVALVYNVDQIADDVPSGGRKCPRCVHKLSGIATPAAPTVYTEEAPSGEPLAESDEPETQNEEPESQNEDE